MSTSLSSPTQWSWYAVAAAAGGAVVVALLVNAFLTQKRGGRRGGKPLGSVDPNVSPAEAIALASASMEAGAIQSMTDLVLWFRKGTAKGTNLKAITLPAAVVEALPALLPGLSSTQRALWNHALVKHRWVKALDARRRTAFDEASSNDVELLKQLWSAASLPGPFSRRSESWNLLGFQGLDPTTDFRGGGMLALDQFLGFAQRHTAALKKMMAFNEAQLADNEPNWYLTAVVSIQLTVQLINEKDHTLHAPQLRVLYGEVDNSDATRSKKVDDDGKTTAPVAGDGMQKLHDELMLHFSQCWARDLPHVMEYNAYMPKVFSSFFVNA